MPAASPSNTLGLACFRRDEAEHDRYADGDGRRFGHVRLHSTAHFRGGRAVDIYGCTRAGYAFTVTLPAPPPAAALLALVLWTDDLCDVSVTLNKRAMANVYRNRQRAAEVRAQERRGDFERAGHKRAPKGGR